MAANINTEWLDAAKLSPDVLANFTWASYFLRNLIPVTIGNIIGGTCVIGGMYWFSYLKYK
jgi:formate/nitrite transporter FocA (FNT family)